MWSFAPGLLSNGRSSAPSYTSRVVELRCGTSVGVASLPRSIRLQPGPLTGCDSDGFWYAAVYFAGALRRGLCASILSLLDKLLTATFTRSFGWLSCDAISCTVTPLLALMHASTWLVRSVFLVGIGVKKPARGGLVCVVGSNSCHERRARTVAVVLPLQVNDGLHLVWLGVGQGWRVF